jgi:hypothetical protein
MAFGRVQVAQMVYPFAVHTARRGIPPRMNLQP